VPEHKPIDLAAIVGGVCAEFQHAADQKSLSLVQELEPVRVLGDAVAIARIARNLIDNAFKYTDIGTVRVALTTEISGSNRQAVLTVTDTGSGIPTAELDRIFEEFYQIDNPGRDRSRGVGLGLAIVQQLCELIGAQIKVESTVGEGTSFRVYLPTVLDGAMAQAPAPAKEADASMKGMRVYVVDDEFDVLKSMRTLLDVWGAEASMARSSVEADQLFAEHGPPDVLIVDLRIGAGEHGAELAARAQRCYGNFPVLIMTGETASEPLKQANAAGYTVLQKPIAPEVLRRAIVAMIETPAFETSERAIP